MRFRASQGTVGCSNLYASAAAVCLLLLLATGSVLLLPAALSPAGQCQQCPVCPFASNTSGPLESTVAAAAAAAAAVEPGPCTPVEFTAAAAAATTTGGADDQVPLLCTGGDSAVLPLNDSLTRAGAALMRGPEDDFAPWEAGFSLANIRTTADYFGANATKEPGSDTHVWMEVGWHSLFIHAAVAQC